MKTKRTAPPRWMDKLIEFYCSKSLIEDLQGDLHEYYHRNREKGQTHADLIYLIDVIKFCRLYTIRKPKILGQMNYFNLLGNYFKTSIRSLARNKLFSSINIVGLAVAMSVGLLMITYISETLTFDNFHEKKDRIYRVTSTYSSITNNDPFDLASNSIYLGEKLQKEYSGFEKVVLLRRNFSADLAKGDNAINVKGLYASPEFFDVFSFKLLAGNPATALVEPNAILLTEKAAAKLFTDENPIGKVLTSEERDFKVTGIIEDLPRNSHIQFEALTSFSTFRSMNKEGELDSQFEWRSIWMNHIYLLFEEGTRPEAVEKQLKEIASVENAKTDRYTITHELQKLADISPGRELSNEIGPTTTWKGIYQLLTLTLIIILSACFNYTNLSIARSLRRAKEVGIRKVVGASRSQVLTQFIFEAVIIAVFSLLLSVGLYLLIKPEFVNAVIDGDNIAMDFQWVNVLYFLLFAILIGVISGLLPSLMLSKLRAISILMDATKLKLFKGVNLRRVLIVFQFAVSMILIIGATITYRQYNFSINYDMGFTSDNILNLPMYGNDAEILLAEIEQLPEVEGTSQSGMIPGTGEVWGERFKYKDPLDSISVHVNWVDKQYIDVHEMTLLAGTTFPFDLKGEEDPKYMIIDRAMSERFGFEDPADAVGEMLKWVEYQEEERSIEIVGVIENYQYANLEYEGEPTALLQGNKKYLQNINIVINTVDVIGLMDKLESIWEGIDKVHPFEAAFMKDQIQQSYVQYEVLFRIFTFLAILAITISTMGLLGMAVFTTETRIKEISIRKVLGASEQNLIFILSRGFMVMLGISALLAIPLTYLFFTEMVLANFTKRISIGVFELLPGVLLIFAIGFLTIGWQTLKAAKSNPADMLRDE